MDQAVMEKRPVVSVIVPYVNHATFIDTCWEHIDKQTFRDFEVIFVDNGSADGSAEKVSALAAAHPGRVAGISENRKGIPFARNAGLHAARGRYVSFLDVDDRFTPEKLSVLVPLLEAHPEAGMAYGQTRRIYSDSGRQVIQDTGVAQPGINNPPSLALDWASSFYRLPQTGATLIRKERAVRAGGFPEQLLMGNDDAAFHIYLALRNKVIYQPFVAVDYFRHDQSEGARLNNDATVHLRYFDAYAHGIEPLGKSVFEKTGDIRLLGIAQRGMFVNGVRCDRQKLPEADLNKFWNYYRLLLHAYRVFPDKVARLIYKTTRRIPAAFFPDRYPLGAKSSGDS
jgi:glycosyltransferase involved in cell wall biosynthesis